MSTQKFVVGAYEESDFFTNLSPCWSLQNNKIKTYFLQNKKPSDKSQINQNDWDELAKKYPLLLVQCTGKDLVYKTLKYYILDNSWNLTLCSSNVSLVSLSANLTELSTKDLPCESSFLKTALEGCEPLFDLQGKSRGRFEGLHFLELPCEEDVAVVWMPANVSGNSNSGKAGIDVNSALSASSIKPGEIENKMVVFCYNKNTTNITSFDPNDFEVEIYDAPGDPEGFLYGDLKIRGCSTKEILKKKIVSRLGSNPTNGVFLCTKKDVLYCVSKSQYKQYLSMAAALLTKGFLILGGVSGVGKTHMARTFSRCVTSIANGGESATIPVSPSWTDETYVTGYWNPLTMQWEATKCLDLMKKAAEKGQEVNSFFAIFDEMNIARPEYYMPNLLSIMEIRGSEGDESKDGTIVIKEKQFPSSPYVTNRAVPLTRNMFIVGTANTDESTFNFSPKIIDRAFYFKFTADDIEFVSPWEENGNTEILDQLAYNFIKRMKELREQTCSPRLQNQGYKVDSWEQKLWVELKNFLETINNTNPDPDSPVAFGTRCINEMTAFIVNYIRLADENADTLKKPSDSGYFKDAFDWAVRTKILPKFSGSENQLNDKLKITKEKVGIIAKDCKSVAQMQNVEQKLKDDGYYIY